MELFKAESKKYEKEFLKLALDQGLNAPISEADEIMPESNVTIPSEENVLQAKDWVDNGSRTWYLIKFNKK